MSLYFAVVPGSAASGVAQAAASSSSLVLFLRKSFSYAGKPEECANSIRTVTSPLRVSLPANSGTMLATGASRSMSPRSYKIIAMVVVATTFETEARSKTVATVTAGELGS